MPRNQKQLNEILDDLFMIDPSLKKYKAEVSRAVQAMLDSKPDTRFDAAFARRLKAELLKKTEATSEPEQTKFHFAGALQKWVFGMSGAAVALAIVLALVQSSGEPTRTSTELAFAPHVASLPGKAFGSLSASLSSATSARPQSGGGGPAFGMGGGGGGLPMAPVSESISTDSKMIAPNPVTYKFVYKGDELKLDQTQGEVYRRLKGELPAASMISNLRALSLNLANLDSFRNLKLTMFQVAEDVANGLAISVDMNEESINIYQNWSKWDYNDQTPSSIPGDDEIIRVAANFLTAHGIDTSSYGPATVDQSWKQYYDLSASTMPVYRPSDLTVRFPLQMNTVPVREQYGDEYGLLVNVNIKSMSVSGVTNLTTQRYEQSMYDLETDASRVIKIAEQGGSPWYWEAEGSKTVEVPLGTPQTVLMRYWLNDGVTSKELYVPALYFPVTDKPADAPYLQNGVTVPLVKDVLEQYGQTPEIMPMGKPLMMESGSAEAPAAPSLLPVTK